MQTLGGVCGFARLQLALVKRCTRQMLGALFVHIISIKVLMLIFLNNTKDRLYHLIINMLYRILHWYFQSSELKKTTRENMLNKLP